MTDSTDAVLIERHDPGVLVVAFNRPETMNAFSSEMSAAFTAALRDADT
ncbi:MAG: enoyl-CoA hydratase, partial [Acidimicrobiia bacterium]|nr:enoyl-CoA hydratase [Acidimicrobiia bacterium]